ncbi:MAG: hypothetical protein HC913_19285 [Microscillaceae bacterium]|nr:hypothetical protein [Microscillaceae bacterium]
MQDWKYTLDQTLHIARRFLREEENVPVLPYQSPTEAAQALPLRLEEKGLSEADFFECLEALVLQTPKTASTGFF